MADVTREELIDRLATQLGIAGAESREARWTDERWQRRVLQDALAALTRPAPSPRDADLIRRLRGEYRIPITDGLGAAGGEEPDNPNEFVRRFETPPIQHEAADRLEVLARMRGAAVPEWRTIDSAPKDGTPIMLFARAKHATAPIRLVGWYLEHEGRWIESTFTNPVGIVPIMWQPLPAAPEAPR